MPRKEPKVAKVKERNNRANTKKPNIPMLKNQVPNKLLLTNKKVLQEDNPVLSESLEQEARENPQLVIKECLEVLLRTLLLKTSRRVARRLARSEPLAE